MNSKKILLVGRIPHDLGSRDTGGVAKVVWNLAKSLKINDYDVSIGAMGRYYKKYQKVENVRIYGIGFSIITLFKTFLIFAKQYNFYLKFSFRQSFKLFRSIYFLSYISEKINFDIIHVHHVINQIPFAAKLIGLDAKIIGTIHSYSSVIMGCKFEKENINFQLKYVDYATHVSNHLRKQAKELNIVFPSYEKVVYNGISITEINNEKVEDKICFVGSIKKMKGIDTLIESFKYIDNQSLELLIIGENSNSEKTKERGNDRRIKYLGAVEYQKTIEFMSKSKMLVNPSKSESFGLVYLEALVAGTPVIGYGPILKEFKEYLALNKNLKEWLIEYDHKCDTPKTLAYKIEEGLFLKGNEKYQANKEEMKNTIKEQFSWQKISLDYGKLYNSIYDENKHGNRKQNV